MDDDKTNEPDDFEFECPQFTDFSTNLERVSEEFCQEYFDKKCEEIKRKSAEFEAQTMMDVDTDHENAAANGNSSNSSGDENGDNQALPPPNLLSHADFTNSSNNSFMSNASTTSNTSHIPTHCEVRNKKLCKMRVQLTTEQMELAKLEERKGELKKLKEKNKKHVAKMRDDGLVFQPTRSTKLTIPITPALHTSMRASSRLRKDRKRKMSAQTAHEHAAHSHPHSHSHRQPARLAVHHSHSQLTSSGNNQSSKKRKPSYSASTKPAPTKTIPQSFKLSKTKRRRASSAVLTTEQKEMREIEKRGAFHARKLNPKLFKSSAGNMGILNNIKNRVTTTKVQAFKLRTEQRAHQHEEKEKKRERVKVKVGDKGRDKEIEKDKEIEREKGTGSGDGDENANGKENQPLSQTLAVEKKSTGTDDELNQETTKTLDGLNGEEKKLEDGNDAKHAELDIAEKENTEITAQS